MLDFPTNYLFLIFALQLVNIYWLVLIFRILYRYIFAGVAKDERSDDEDDEEEEDDDDDDDEIEEGEKIEDKKDQ